MTLTMFLPLSLPMYLAMSLPIYLPMSLSMSVHRYLCVMLVVAWCVFCSCDRLDIGFVVFKARVAALLVPT